MSNKNNSRMEVKLINNPSDNVKRIIRKKVLTILKQFSGVSIEFSDKNMDIFADRILGNSSIKIIEMLAEKQYIKIH